MKTHLSFLTISVISLLLRKGVYRYEFIIDWGKFNEKYLSEKIRILLQPKYGRYYRYSDYNHAKIFYKDFEIKILGRFAS